LIHKKYYCFRDAWASNLWIPDHNLNEQKESRYIGFDQGGASLQSTHLGISNVPKSED